MLPFHRGQISRYSQSRIGFQAVKRRIIGAAKYASRIAADIAPALLGASISGTPMAVDPPGVRGGAGRPIRLRFGKRVRSKKKFMRRFGRRRTFRRRRRIFSRRRRFTRRFRY